MNDLPRALTGLKLENDWVHCRLDLFRSLTGPILRDVLVDEKWYLTTYKDVGEAVKNKLFANATKHYKEFGYLEGRLPFQPFVDERWYINTYPDVAKALSRGDFLNAVDHFVRCGYAEGRDSHRNGS